MASVTRWLEKRLKLRVNREKSAVDRPWRRKFLGFSFTNHRQPKRRTAPQSVVRFKQLVRWLTRRSAGQSLQSVVTRLSRYLRGWLAYFGFCQTRSVLAELEEWIRRRLRCPVWKQWNRVRTHFRELVLRVVSAPEAAKTADSAHALWRISRRPALSIALPNAYFAEPDLPQLRVRDGASI